MSYLIKAPLFSYLIEYFNDKLGFRESKIITMDKSELIYLGYYFSFLNSLHTYKTNVN